MKGMEEEEEAFITFSSTIEEMTPRHIGIGIHSVGNVADEVVFSLIPAMMRAAKKLENTHFSFCGVSRSKVAAARNKVVEDLIKMGCTHWLSLDTDHLIHLDFVEQLVSAMGDDVGVVSGLIHKRAYPFHQVAFKFRPGRDSFSLVNVNPAAGVVEVDAAAFGCTLINIEALQQKEVPFPWFFDNERGRSDMNFCRLVRKAGLKVLINTAATVGHLLDPQVLWPEIIEEARDKFSPMTMGAK